uniref:efflux RND transporter periplasmic adaptor subunit n=2 Tax=Roseivirga sp. TaxID=1964215 RepID=UPI004048EA8C
MKILEIIKSKNTLAYIGVLIAGILIGWLLIGGTGNENKETLPADHSAMDHKEGTIWTCSMHPQIQRDAPGNCPICGMELIPMKQDDESADEAGQYSVKLSNAAMKIAEVEMTTIERKAPYKEVYLPGKVMADERNIVELTARYPGRIEKLMVNFTGQKVNKGQVLAKIYSPELVTAQRELFEAIKFKETSPAYYKASRNKLKLWDLTEAQIDQIEQSGAVDFYFDVLSPITGTVTMRHVTHGDYVKEGTALFEVVNLGHVWVMFDAYESDIPWVKMRDKIKFKIKSMPGREFESTVTFIDPVINPMSRVAKVRAELDNPRDLLKPEMLADGLLKTMLPGSGDQVVIPKSAVLWTGKKAVVYVMTSDHNNMFQFREIELGADAGDYYVVESGLEEGEMVASNGVFKIDAAAQLKGEKSMMNPEGGKVSMGHNHGGSSEEKKPASGSEHEGHDESSSENTMKMDMSIDENFKKQLTNVYKVHLDLQQAFLATDAAAAKKQAGNVKSALDKVDMSLVKGDMHDQWMNSLKTLKTILGNIESGSDIEKQRLAFADFNDALYSAIKMFGVVNETVYYQFCPMARNGAGAYWLSAVKEIKNPYYGEAMLTCGENKEVIE